MSLSPFIAHGHAYDLRWRARSTYKPMNSQLTQADIETLFDRPLLDLVFEAAAVHREHHDPQYVQRSQLLSIKTGGCPEDCGYCSQSAHNKSDTQREALLEVDQVLSEAKRAKDGGADRFCMGAAWREVREGEDFERVLKMVSGVKQMGLETCVTLGMLDASQAGRLREAGLDYYNHNLDTGASHYDQVVTTRTYQDRLDTLGAARAAGLSLCCGGILGLGEDQSARAELLHTLAHLDPQPESVPINTLVAVDGTPMEGEPSVPWDELVRMVAVARILLPRTTLRLSAGRNDLTDEAQALCFLAGANSIFVGDELLTTQNVTPPRDAQLLTRLGMHSTPPLASEDARCDAPEPTRV
ncbi:MAG: biotin synthase [Planctomycetota bacterium]|jgi:biotin synthase